MRFICRATLLKIPAMRVIKRIVLALIILLVLAIAALWATDNEHVLYGARKTYFIGKKNPDIDDMAYFDVRKVAADNYMALDLATNYNRQELLFDEQAWSDSMGTTALLVFRHDSLLFEQYREGTENTLSNSFSMAKSITSILIGIAIDEGFIGSVDDRVGDYVEAYSSEMDTLLTIRHLLEMTSGIPFGESYSSPFGYMAKSYYGKDLTAATLGYHVQKEPGTLWAYEGGNTVLLGMILSNATGMMVSDYCSSRLWSRIGSEHDAYWNLDKEAGIEKTFSGFYAAALDFSRLGMLFMHDGIWRGDTIVSPEWVRASLTPHGVPDEKSEACTWYGRQWWLGEHGGHSFFACRGLRGQYVICVPDLELMVVRLGHSQSKERVRHMPADLYRYLEIAMRISQS
jgi:CubicO group peptidase (beta-lactamase class C family)